MRVNQSASGTIQRWTVKWEKLSAWWTTAGISSGREKLEAGRKNLKIFPKWRHSLMPGSQRSSTKVTSSSRILIDIQANISHSQFPLKKAIESLFIYEEKQIRPSQGITHLWGHSKLEIVVIYFSSASILNSIFLKINNVRWDSWWGSHGVIYIQMRDLCWAKLVLSLHHQFLSLPPTYLPARHQKLEIYWGVIMLSVCCPAPALSESSYNHLLVWLICNLSLKIYICVIRLRF